MNNLKPNKTAALLLSILLSLLIAAPGVAQESGQAEVQFQAAYHQQIVEGQLDQAIARYKKLVAKYPDDRAVAAKALVEMGECYEKLGKDQARQAYERVLRDYPDQSAEANEARARLAALEHGAHGTELVTRRVWAGPDVDSTEGSVSPDGRYLSYVNWETNNVALYDIATGEKRDVTHNDLKSGDLVLDSRFSPDGKRIAYTFLDENKDLWELRVIGVDGSGPRVLYKRKTPGEYVAPAGWSSDGQMVLALLQKSPSSPTKIALISAVNGSARVLKTLGSHRFNMAISPDGRYVAYDYVQDERSGTHDIALLPTDGGPEIPLVQNPADDRVLGWTPDGANVLFASDRAGSMSAWLVHVEDGKPDGLPRLVKPDIGRAFPMGFTRNGSFYYGVATGAGQVYQAALDPVTDKLLGQPSPITQRFVGTWPSVEFSPDGKYLAYSAGQQFNYRKVLLHLYIRSLKTGEERELSPDLWSLGELRWSPDDRSILAQGFDNKKQEGFYLINVQNGGVTPVLRTEPETYSWHEVWDRGGKAIFYVRNVFAAKTSSILQRDLKTGTEKELYRAPSGFWLMNLALSPDGSQLAFTATTNAGDLHVLSVMPAAGGESHKLLRLKRPEGIAGDSLAWTPNGQNLLFITVKGTKIGAQTMELSRIPLAGGHPQELGPLATHQTTWTASLSLRPDGGQIIFAVGSSKGEVWVMENFLPALKASR